MDNSVGVSPAFITVIETIRSHVSLEFIFGVVVTMAMLYLEVTRRTANLPRQEGGDGATSWKKVLRNSAPEATGVIACAGLSIYLRFYGSHAAHVMENNAAWEEIVRQWPLLLTADTLLAIQAMLRVLILVSNVLRARGGSALLSQEVAGISLGAALGRAALAARSTNYFLDGPLGGYLPVACEVLSVPLLAILCRGIRRKALTASLSTVAIAAWIGSRNQLALSNDAITDGLFLFAHAAELFAAFAYLSRALLSDDGIASCKSVSMCFTHLLMPVQQCMSAYYFVQAFAFVPELVAAGHPFEMLQMGGVAQVGAYAGAAVLHLAEYLETPTDELAMIQNQGSNTEASQQGTPQSANAVPRHIAVPMGF